MSNCKGRVMRVFGDRNVAAAWPTPTDLSSLIESIGRPNFTDRFFALIHAICECQHVSIFRFNAGRKPEGIYAQSIGQNRDAEVCAKRYTERYWHLDPINEMDTIDDGNLAGVYTLAADIPANDYRNACYTSVGLGSRLTIFGQSDGPAESRARLNVYVRGKFFSESSIEKLFESSQVLLSLAQRHADDLPMAGSRNAPDFEHLLRSKIPSLTPRETQVCAQIARGLTSEGIALELGVSINTVLTYRKRAYERMGITSQNELMRAFM